MDEWHFLKLWLYELIFHDPAKGLQAIRGRATHSLRGVENYIKHGFIIDTKSRRILILTIDMLSTKKS